MFWSRSVADATPGSATGAEAEAFQQRVHQRDLARRLRKLEKCFPVAQIRAEHLGPKSIQAYYAANQDAYRKYHSREGAVHMALNDGPRFDPDGLAGQVRRFEALWRTPPPAAVMEIGFGQGYNLAYLAQRHPHVQLHGIDLSPAHLPLAHRNVHLVQADLHALPMPAASLDEVFAVEAFCYATDLPRAFGELWRVLKPGGRFTVFDAYITRPMAQMDADGALAVDLVGRGMAVDSWQVIGPFLDAAAGVGFQRDLLVNLDVEVRPSLQRLERICGAVIRFPWLGRRALARRAPERGRNVLAGYLLERTVAMGLLCYRQVVLRKPAVHEPGERAALETAQQASAE
jgi:SAM-dependent methyltransferase